MTARPPLPPNDAPLSAEERELAARLARLDASAGPSAALDARILGAARAAVARPTRRARWPQAVGAAAVLVAAVGLAWQLRPMFQLPAPLHRQGAGDGHGAAPSETVVQVEPVPPSAPAPLQASGDVAPPPAAQARSAAVAKGRTASPRPAPAAAAPAPRASVTHESADEAVPPLDAALPDRAAPMAAAAPAPASAAQKAAVAEATHDAAAEPAPPSADARADIEADARLPRTEWIARIRERRDAGDLAGARASLARFVRLHPRARVPADLRPLLDDGDPWAR